MMTEQLETPCQGTMTEEFVRPHCTKLEYPIWKEDNTCSFVRDSNLREQFTQSLSMSADKKWLIPSIAPSKVEPYPMKAVRTTYGDKVMK